jgi:predicted PhzF superfamily epimerase YddE/YHI9
LRPGAALKALNIASATASTDGAALLLEIASEAEVRALKPDFEALSALDA